MTFEEVLDQAIAMLQRRGRLTYRALRLQFNLDDEYFDILKDELIYGQQLAVDEGGRVLVWRDSGGAAWLPPSARPPAQAAAPLAYTPQHLTDKILASRTALEGERKHVTVVFADIKGSTELIEGLDPEEAQDLLDPAIHIMMNAVHRYEGTVNQVLGDGIMALFGAPIAHEDHAIRACYAALAMQAAMRDYTEEVRRGHGIEMRIGLGLNSGEVVVRTIGNDLHMDYSAVGQTTHLAARMEQLAPPGSVRLTAATLRLVEGMVRVDALGPIPVKGMTAPVEVYELTGATALRRRLQVAAARGLARFVGRETEMSMLKHALEQVTGGHGQAVAVVGEAGVGKSRLVYDFLHSSHTQGWLVLEGTAVPYGQATAYFPVIDLLKHYVHIEDHDEPDTIRAKVTGHVLALDAGLQESIPALLSLLHALPEESPFLMLDPPQRRQRTLDALKRVFWRESQVRPLVLVFEDLHWIDAETQALLDGLIEMLPTAPILLLVNYRPEYHHAWENQNYYTQLRLDPLPPASADQLLQALLGDDASLKPLKQLLIARTAGNPFFLEESVRALVETQVLVGEPSAYRLTQALPTIQVPATVQAVLAARIDRLPFEEKRLLQTAAVIGTEVPFPLLRAVAEMSEEALHRSLTHLQAGELFYETRLFPERVYRFKHALTHDVAYDSLLQERRRVLHARIVEALEALAGERLADQVERLAHHALRGEVWDKALLYFRQAGARALARSAYHEAVACFEQALEALQYLPESRDTQELAIDLRFDLRTALLPLGVSGRILDALHQAETLAGSLYDHRRLGRVALYMTIHFYSMGDYDRAIASGQRSLVLAEASEDVGLRAIANTYQGVAYHAQGDYRRAVECCRQTVTALEGELLYDHFGQVFIPSIFSRALLAWCLGEVGAFAEGIAIGEEGLRVAEAAEHPASLMRAYFGVGVPYLLKGEFHKALLMLERALDICQNVGLPFYMTDIAVKVGAAYALSGHIPEALPLLEEAAEQANATGRRNLYARCAAQLSETYLRAGRIEEASDLARRALALFCEYKERGHQARILWLLGEIAVHRHPGEAKPAEARYRQALALARERDMRPLLAHCHGSLGTLYSKMGQRESASAELSTAIELYRAMEMSFWLPQAEAALAQMEGQS